MIERAIRPDGDLAELDADRLADEVELDRSVIEALLAEARETSRRDGGPVRAIFDRLVEGHRRPAPGRVTPAMSGAVPPTLPGPGKLRLTDMAPAREPATPLANRQPVAELGRVLAKRDPGGGPRTVDDRRVSSAMQASAGFYLPDHLRQIAEQLLGEDLSEVVIHDDRLADSSAAELGARAFTIGPHIFFRRGMFAPNTEMGRRLLLHELTHAAQWIRGDVAAGASLEVSRQSDPLEVEAERTAAAMASAFLPGEAPAIGGRTRRGRPGPSAAAALPWRATSKSSRAAPKLGSTPSGQILREGETSSEATGDDAMCIGAPTEVPEGGTDINRPGRVFWSGDPKLRLRGSDSTTADNIVGELEFNEKVQVIKEFPGSWYFVSREDGTLGYVYKVHIRTDLPEPNAQLHLVEGGTSAIGIAEQYYGEYADDWGQDLRFYVNVLAWANNITVPDTTSGWREVHFQAGDKIWIPSHQFARSLKGVVNSGSYTYNFADAIGVAEVIERIGELWDDFAHAIELAGQYIPEALGRHAIEGIERALEALVHMLLIAGFIMILSTLLGAAIGALVGGAGAAPGAAIGFDVGLAVLEWMGLAFLVVWIADALIQVGSAFGSFLGMVWDARGDESVLEAAAQQLAEALGLLVGKLIEGLVMLVAAKGIGYVMGRIGNSKFGQKMGSRFREWLSEKANGRGQGENTTGRGRTGEGENTTGRTGEGETTTGRTGEGETTTGRTGEGETTTGRQGTAEPVQFSNRTANELIESSHGRRGNDGNSQGHAMDHVPPDGATRAQVEALAQTRPQKPNTTVYRNHRHAVQDLRNALNGRSEAIARLEPGGEGLKIEADLPSPRQGMNSRFGETPSEVSFTRITIYIERAPDGSLTLIHFTPRLAGL